MSVANISYGCSSLQCEDSDRQTGCIEEMVCSCVVYILVTEYNDKYTHTRVHEVLEACKQLSRKETFVTYTPAHSTQWPQHSPSCIYIYILMSVQEVQQ